MDKSKQLSDASEGKTVFVRNLSYVTEVESLNEFMSRFGPTDYCKICVDPSTDHSKGSAFVKFKEKSDAEKCVNEGQLKDDSFYLDGRQLNVTIALTRNKLKELGDKRVTKDRDKRNLYLAKEGLIYPKSPAAEGLSQTDLTKRLALETKKRKLLQNNHYFVSQTRLCVHNLPHNVDNNKLRSIFMEAVNDKNAKIIEARVMYDVKKLEKQFGKSKGFGFVEFTEHSHALKALRQLNNNPDIFTQQKRPIVEFSIENKLALNKKAFRAKKNIKKCVNSDVEAQVDNDNEEEEEVEEQNYSGVMSKPNRENEKIKAPKVSRKLSEMRKELKTRGKKLKLKKNKAIKEVKHKEKVEKRKMNKSKASEVNDIHDSHYRKRKHIFLQNKSRNLNIKKPKKAKWFIENQ